MIVDLNQDFGKSIRLYKDSRNSRKFWIMEGNQNVDEWGSIDGSNGVNRKGNNSTKNGNATGKDVRSTISNNNNADSHQEESTAEDERKLSSDVLL